MDFPHPWVDLLWVDDRAAQRKGSTMLLQREIQTRAKHSTWRLLGETHIQGVELDKGSYQRLGASEYGVANPSY